MHPKRRASKNHTQLLLLLELSNITTTVHCRKRASWGKKNPKTKEKGRKNEKNVWEQNTHHDLYEQNLLLSGKICQIVTFSSSLSLSPPERRASFLLASELNATRWRRAARERSFYSTQHPLGERGQ